MRPRPGEAGVLGLRTTRPVPDYLRESAEPPVSETAKPAPAASAAPAPPKTTPKTTPKPAARPPTAPARRPVPATADPAVGCTSAAAPPVRRWLWWAIGVMAAILVAFAIVRPLTMAASAPKATPVSDPGSAYSYYDIRGFLTLAGPKGVLVSTSSTVDGTGDAECWGQSQYQDIGYGAVVTVFNDADQIVAYGSLGQGRASRTGPGGATVSSCVFPILVHDVPTGSGFYQVQVAQRGTVMVPSEPEDGVLYAFLALDDAPGSLPKVADQPPKLPQSIG